MNTQGRVTALWRGDRGSVSVIAAAIAFPAVIALLAAFFQGALWFAGREAALSAAQQGVTAARGTGGTDAGGQAAACSYVATTGHGMLTNPSCTVTGTATVTVTVCGDTPRLIPFPVHVCMRSDGPREIFSTRVNP
jgi:hypothetical protein